MSEGPKADQPIPGFFPGTGMPDPGWWEALWPDPANVLAVSGMRPGCLAVDLCAGDGWFTVPMAIAAEHVIAVDIDAALLARARVRLAERGLSNCTFITSDAYDLADVVAQPVDYVLLANAFHGVPDRLRLARAVHSVLKPGGLFAVVNWHNLPREQTPVLGEPSGPATEQRISPEETIAQVELAGLSHQLTVQVSPHHYGSVFRRA